MPLPTSVVHVSLDLSGLGRVAGFGLCCHDCGQATVVTLLRLESVQWNSSLCSLSELLRPDSLPFRVILTSAYQFHWGKTLLEL